MVDTKYLKQHVYDVVGAIYEVHRELGAGLNEFCYQEGLEIELCNRSIDFHREPSFHPLYNGKEMKAIYRLDFICKDDIVVECRSVTALTPDHRAQLFNYMRLTDSMCGILVNFKPKYAVVERYFYDSNTQEILSVDGVPII